LALFAYSPDHSHQRHVQEGRTPFNSFIVTETERTEEEDGGKEERGSKKRENGEGENEVREIAVANPVAEPAASTSIRILSVPPLSHTLWFPAVLPPDGVTHNGCGWRHRFHMLKDVWNMRYIHSLSH
jgi:hypothetical protein